MKILHGFGLLAMVAASSLGAMPEAAACGGMFCDSGPTAMPVDQKGENILFVVDKDAGTVEAHIQIQYQGEASRFAWVIPVQSTPTLSVGSEPLFTSLLQGTVPLYGFSTQRDTCFDNNASLDGDSAGPPGSAGSAGASAGGGGGPTVLYQKQVGAFEAAVLQGGTSEEVMTWLGDNGYQQTPAAEPILKEYLEKNYLFAAIKLTGGAGIDEIHPLVVKYHGDQPCVPLKLTAIAATADMGVRTFFLDQGRWVPKNFKHLELNPVRLNWLNASNYTELVSRAADSDVAMGQAFVTEYAGPSSAVSSFGLFREQWDAAPFEAYKPVFVVGELEKQGLMQCGVYIGQPGGVGGFGGSGGNMGCVYNHPLLKGLVNEYLPAPASIPEDEFYDNLDKYEADIDASKWDGPAFAAKLRERVIEPGKHASELLQANPYLTRLFTTISPAEMTVDPEFHPRHDLPEVVRSQQASRRILCNSESGMKLPDTRDVALTADAQWPSWTDEMPWAEKITEIPAEGPAIELKVNTPKINELLAAWNKSRGWPPPAPGTDASGQPATPGASAGAGGSAGAPPSPEGGCNTGRRGLDAGWLVLAAAGLLGLKRRR